MKGHPTSQNKPTLIVRIIKTPIQAISKAKDYYIKGINSFSTTYNRPTMINRDANRMITMQLPRSLSTTVLSNDHSGNQQPRGRNMADPNSLLRSSASRKGVPRSVSVGMSRIDEDRVASFRNDNILFEHKFIVNDNGSRVPRNLGRVRSGSRF